MRASTPGDTRNNVNDSVTRRLNCALDNNPSSTTCGNPVTARNFDWLAPACCATTSASSSTLPTLDNATASSNCRAAATNNNYPLN
jgi:hypothetical protein